MDQKIALVTGGTRGIGYGISSVLASQGYSLVLGEARLQPSTFLHQFAPKLSFLLIIFFCRV